MDPNTWMALLSSGVITLQSMVGQMAMERGIDPALARETVRLESAWDPRAVGDNGLAVGLWQFRGKDSSGTWGWLCKVTGHPEWSDDLNRLDPVKESIVALDAIALGYGDHWSGWRVAVRKESGR